MEALALCARSSEKRLLSALCRQDMVFEVAYQFTSLHRTTKESLTKGVKDIKDEEIKHGTFESTIPAYG